MKLISVYYVGWDRYEDECWNHKELHSPFIPRIGDTVVINKEEFTVEDVVIDLDEGDYYVNVK